MGVTVLIPARMESTRLEGKPLIKLGRYPMIVHVALRSKLSLLVDDVYVCTDSEEIVRACESYNINCCVTSSRCLNGTERIHDAFIRLGLASEDLIIDVQGDEPLVAPEAIDRVISEIHNQGRRDYIYLPHVAGTDRNNKNIVKVIAAKNRALFLTRADAPCQFVKPNTLLKHLSIIGFTGRSLTNFAGLEPGELENVEGIELLRAIEGGMEIFTFPVSTDSFSVDVASDVEKACLYLESCRLYNHNFY